MIGRYGWLFLSALAAAGIAGVVARNPRSAAPEKRGIAQAHVPMAVVILAHDIMVSPASIPSGAVVELTVANRCPAGVRLSLAGFEDRVDVGPLAPGDTARVTFLADRPGNRFAWRVGNELMGRLDVTGSHLVEGHR